MKNSQSIVIGAGIVAAALVIGALLTSGGSGQKPDSSLAPSVPAVTQEGGRQIITVTASGGYFPRSISAKAGVPTTLRMISDKTYGCEASFSIPALGVSRRLPSSGTTEIDIGTLSSGKSLLGTCSMGMYTFTIKAS